MQDIQDPKTEKLQTLLRRLYGQANGEAAFMLEDKQRYLAHAILQSILFSIKQECVITLDTTENCINDGTSGEPIEVTSLIEHMQTKNENPSNRQEIQPETLYFMRFNGYNDLIQDNKYLQDKYLNFDTYNTIYIDALEGIAQDNLDILSSLPQEIQEVVEEYQGVLLDIAQREKKVLITQNPNTPLEKLNDIFNIANTFNNEINKARVFASIARNPNANKDLLNSIFEEANTFNNEINKANVFAGIAKNPNADLLDIIETANTLNKNHKTQILKCVLENSQISDYTSDNNKILTAVLNETKNLYATQKEQVFNKIAVNHESVLKEVIQEALFGAYENCDKTGDTFQSFQDQVKKLLPIPIAYSDLQKAFKAIERVDKNGTALTKGDKKILQHDQGFMSTIEKICHYIAKVVTLGQAMTQKDARDDFKSAINQSISLMKNNNSGQGINM